MTMLEEMENNLDIGETFFGNLVIGVKHPKKKGLWVIHKTLNEIEEKKLLNILYKKYAAPS
jgi:hypothetical protein